MAIICRISSIKVDIGGGPRGNPNGSGHLLQIIQPMLAGFKLEIAKMRSEGATQAEIDLMLDEFEQVYAPDDDDEGKLVIAVLRQAARPS